MRSTPPTPGRQGSQQPRNAFVRWWNPTPESSWTALWSYAALWVVLIFFWLGYLIFVDQHETYRVVLYIALILVGLTQLAQSAGSMLRKRQGPRSKA